MSYKIIFPRPVLEWFCNELLPVMQQMANARLNLYDKKDAEYLNNGIVKYLLDEIQQQFIKEQKTAIRKNRMILLNHPQLLTLFRFLHNYPVPEDQRWKTVQKNYVLRQIVELVPDLKQFVVLL